MDSMPWVTLNDDLQDLPGHGDKDDENKSASPLLISFWQDFSGDTLWANEPELWSNRCGTSIVWRLGDERLNRWMQEKGLPRGSTVLLCPHQVRMISYTLGNPMMSKKVVDVNNELIAKAKEKMQEEVTVRRKFRH